MGKFFGGSTLRSALLAPAMALLGVSIALAAITGSISGVVADPSGAVTPGVTVVATSLSTNVRHVTTTDSKGFYSFPALSVDMYNVTISQPGYKDFLESGVKIDTDSAVRVDIKLALGTVNDTVTIKSDSLQIETESTQMGDVIEGSQIVSMPLNGRSYLDLLALQPGVSPYPSTGGAGVVSINGGRPSSNGYMVNGADAEEKLRNAAGVIPVLDSIAEFRIITNNFNAEYGNYSGGQINVVTKSGTNQYHGNVFDFLRNTDLDAKNYFSSQRGIFIQNQFGGTLGAPIKRDKAFVFGDYQGTRQIIGAAQLFQVPSLADRSGNLIDQASSFIQATPANGGGGVVGNSWADTLTQELGYSVTAGEPYYTQGCTTTAQCVFPNAVIPQSAWSPVAVNTLKYIPTPNVPGVAEYETSAYNATYTEDKGAARADANTRFGGLFGYYFFYRYNNINPYGSSNVPGFATDTKGKTQVGNLGLTSSHNSAVNDLRLVYFRDVNQSGVPIGGLGPSLASLGFNTPWNNTGGISSVNPSIQGIPFFYFNNFDFGASSGFNTFNNTVQLIDNVTKIVGTHSIQVGGDFHYDQINIRLSPADNGAFNFGGAETGVDFADFLIGAPDGFTQASYQILDSRGQYYGVYAQDSWRVAPTLTVNYGLRYEVMTPWYDTQNKLSTLLPGEQSQVFPDAPLGLVFPGDKGISRGISPILRHNFAPRFGVAYAPDLQEGMLRKILGGPGKSSIRAGYGLFYTSFEDIVYLFATASAPYGQYYQSPAPPLLASPFVDRSTGHFEGIKFPFIFPPTNVSIKNPDTAFNFGQVVPLSGGNYLNPKNVTPYTQNFELSLQRQLGNATVMSLSYVGTVGRHNFTFIESNPGDPALCLSVSQTSQVAAGTATCGPFGEQGVYTTAAGQVINSTRPLFGANFGANPYTQTSASSSYNSMQGSLQHTDRYDNFLVAYTYSKSIDNGSNFSDNTNPYNPSLSRALSTFDTRHALVASYTVQLPFNNYLGNGDVAKRITAGWAVSGISTFASGQPVSLVEGDDRSLSGTFGGTIDVPSVANNGSKLYVNRNPRSGQPYFNNSTYFVPEPLGQVGDAARRFFPGPGLLNTNLALVKNTQITERSQLQFRAEAFNVFNHAQFLNPAGNINNGGVGGFGYSTSARDPRIMQVALKLSF